jgi:16S rRNA (adenine1518-N6/adenine1519-N6)-dimethyltransferase
VLPTKETIRRYLGEKGARPRKKWGQNFFLEQKQLQRLVADLDWRAVELAVEVGPGFGALTEAALASSRERETPFALVEIDPVLFAYLAESYKGEGRVGLYHEDFLTQNARYRQVFESPGSKKAALLGNIPYNITSAVAQEFLLNASYLWAFLVVQREVGEGWLTGWGQNRLASLLQLHGRVSKLGAIQPQSFYPEPKVASMAVCLQKDLSFVRGMVHKYAWSLSASELLAVSEKLFKVLFWGRKKNLKSILKNNPHRPLTAKEVDSVLVEADVDGGLRVNALDKEAFLRLAHSWSKYAMKDN